MKFKLHRIIIYVKDPVQCASLYRDKFLLKQIGEWTREWAEVDGGECNIGFHLAYDNEGPIKTSTGHPENPHKIVFLVDNVIASKKKLEGAGVRMLEINRFDDWEICTGYDCEGHAFQISNK